MKLYRRKPVSVTAVQWWPPEDSRHEMLTPIKSGSASCNVGDIRMFPLLGGEWEYAIKLKDGDRILHPGDWIIGSGPNAMAIDDVGFRHLYEEVES